MGKCTPTEALDLLRQEYSSADAAERITEAFRRRAGLLFCDGVAVKPHFAPRLMLVARFDDKEYRWSAEIVSAVREAWARLDYRWEFDVDELVALLPARPGALGTNWKIYTRQKLARLGRKSALDLHNRGELLPQIKQFLQREIKYVAKDDKRLRAEIQAFLHPPQSKG
jgi:hypothetical protein